MAIKRIVIVGGGTAGWMTAATMAPLLAAHRDVSITLIESEAIGTVGVGEATIPTFVQFNQLLGIPENDLLEAVQGTFKLGIHFVNWERQGDSYFHPFGDYGYEMNGITFPHVWLKYRMAGDTRPLHKFSAETMLAMHRKFAHSDGLRSDLPGVNYAYHLDAGLYARLLRSHAEARGVTRREGKVADATLDGENGFVTSVTMDDGETIEGDFFIDCSGFRGLLIEQKMETGYEEWTHWLPCDRAVALPSKGDGTILPYTRATAHSAGWQWRVPLQHRNGNGHVYCSSFMESDEALDILLDNVDGKVLGDPNHLRFVTGHRKKFWNKNVVAIGLSAGFMEPLESTSIHLINTAVNKLVSLFSLDGVTKTQEETFNRLTLKEYARIRDFLILHYNATKRDDSEFWNYCRTMEIPDTLQQKIDLFRLNAQIFREEDELFTETSWIAVLLGQGIVPTGFNMMAAGMGGPQLDTELDEMERSIAYLVSQTPGHEEYLKRFCPAPVPEALRA
ncbi:tryptophan halogenase family protein [Sphingomicrobium sp. XHP0239]|uniref:tryptophan halogenase family protein n=1 Tax=Sphingomicrobium maritimum TaxID=3133972 RepID=UPI0031CC5BEF